MTIQVLGSGCPACKKLFETVKKIVADLGIEAEVEYINDIAKMVEMGVMQSPVLAIDNRPVLTGGGHSEEEIKNVLMNKSKSESKTCACGDNC